MRWGGGGGRDSSVKEFVVCLGLYCPWVRKRGCVVMRGAWGEGEGGRLFYGYARAIMRHNETWCTLTREWRGSGTETGIVHRSRWCGFVGQWRKEVGRQWGRKLRDVGVIYR